MDKPAGTLEHVTVHVCMSYACWSICCLQNPQLQQPATAPSQSVEEIQRLVQLARTVGPVSTGKPQDADGAIDEAMAEVLDEEFEDEGFGASGGGGFVV